MKRLYKFISARWGLVALRDQRLRVSRIEELNDDFEFIGVALKSREERIAMREMRRHINEKNGILCMADSWHDPVMWGHYGDSYSGMVLGFDVNGDRFYPVEYVPVRPTLQSMGYTTADDFTPEDIKRFTKLKASGWGYENEWRAYLPLEAPEVIDGKNNYFLRFNPYFRLKEVIVGPRFEHSREDVRRALAQNGKGVEVYMARGDFDEFKVVRQGADTMWR